MKACEFTHHQPTEFEEKQNEVCVSDKHTFAQASPLHYVEHPKYTIEDT